MRYLSLFSGMEAAHLAWSPLGWTCVGVAETAPAPRALLCHHLPDLPNLGSVTDITDDHIAALGPFDVVIGGSPCQDLSVAGRRAGLAGARSSLFHHQMRIFNAARHFCGARWLIWENVPGAFSSNKGRDFAVVVGAMAGCDLPVPSNGWGSEGIALGDNGLVEWSVLDAQWFGVAQRRRRVFAVLDTGNWADRRPVLLEPESMRGNFAPSRDAGQSFAASVGSCTANGGWPHDVTGTLDTYYGDKMGLEDQHIFNQRGSRFVPAVTGTISARVGGGGGLGTDFECQGGLVPALLDKPKVLGISDGIDQESSDAVGMGVRRLTPRECERLQGAPDDWSLVPNRRGKPMADGPRYRMLGNSFAVPVIRWIGMKIASAHQLPGA